MGVRFAHNPLHVQQATPPSAEKVAPVVKLESSLSAKHIVLAMSSGVPSRCRGRVLYVFVRGWPSDLPSDNNRDNMGVSIGPLFQAISQPVNQY